MRKQLFFPLVASGFLLSGFVSQLLAADVTGIWHSEFDSQIGHQIYNFTFKQDGSKLIGKANSEAGDRKREAELKNGKVEGDTISFEETLSIQDREIQITYTGKLSSDGNEIKFTRGVVYLKLVNTSASTKPIQIEVAGAPKLKAKGEAVVLAAKALDDTNSIDKSENLIPHTETVTGISSSFSRDLPPYSITVLKLKTK